MAASVASKPAFELVSGPGNVKHIVCHPERLSNALRPDFTELAELHTQNVQFQELLNSPSYAQDGKTQIPSFNEMSTIEVMQEQIIPFPLKTPRLLAMLFSIDHDLRNSSRMPEYTDAASLYKIYRIFFAYVVRNPRSKETGRSDIAQKRWIERRKDVLTEWGTMLSSDTGIKKLSNKLALERTSRGLEYNSQLDLVKHYDPTLTEIFYQATYEYVCMRVLNLELAILHCLGISPEKAAMEDFLTTLHAPRPAEIPSDNLIPILQQIDDVLDEEGSPYSRSCKLGYPAPSEFMRRYALPNGYMFETLCIVAPQ